jgi:hypothetical protein
MSIKKIIEWDKRNLERMKKFQLPNRYKRVGIMLAVLAFLALIALRFIDDEPLWTKVLVRNLMLVGLLIVSISKEKIEDEMIASIRMQSYALALIIGVLYSVIQPLVNSVVFAILKSDKSAWEIGHFQVMIFMLLVQVMFFYVMLKKCRV